MVKIVPDHKAVFLGGGSFDPIPTTSHPVTLIQ